MKLCSSDEIGVVGGANQAKGIATVIVVPPRVLAITFAEYAPEPVPPPFLRRRRLFEGVL